MDLHADMTLTLLRISQLQALTAVSAVGSAPAASAMPAVGFAQQLALAQSALSPGTPDSGSPAPATSTMATPPSLEPSPFAEQYPTGEGRLGPTISRF